MATHSSVTVREETSHLTETIQITISDALKRRAQSLINDHSIDPQWRTIIRYAWRQTTPGSLTSCGAPMQAKRSSIRSTSPKRQKAAKTTPVKQRSKHCRKSSAGPVMNLPRRCLCSWEHLNTPRIRSYSLTKRSTQPLHDAASRTCMEWSTLSLR